MHLIRLAPLAALLLAGCATHANRWPTPAFAPTALARVVPMGNPQSCSIVLSRGQAIYGRTQADAPVLYVGKQPIAALQVGQTLCVEVIDGSHSITMSERRLTLPVGFTAPLSYTFPRAQPLHLQYGQTARGANRAPVTYFIEAPAHQQGILLQR